MNAMVQFVRLMAPFNEHFMIYYLQAQSKSVYSSPINIKFVR